MARRPRTLVTGAALLTVLGVAAPAQAATPPANPYLGPVGTATMHGDAESSDTTPNPGPGSGAVSATYVPLAAACPTILQGADGYVQALCTTIADRTPTVYLLDPATGLPLSSLAITKGSLLGGVYAYLDNADRLVVADGNDNLLRIGHARTGPGETWQLTVVQSTPLGTAVWGHCGAPGCDGVTSLMPDFAGRVWFATGAGVAGYADPNTGAVRSQVLGDGTEHVDNSIASAPGGVAVATDHALYLLSATTTGLSLHWRAAYDRGPARKPGQLSWGTGSTPTFFGPRTRTEYVTVVDNAVPQEHLLVYASGSGHLACSIAVLPVGASGSENSPIGAGRSVYVASTYGYPYPALPADAGPSDPATAPFPGGMTRVDLDNVGCHVTWTNTVRSAAVPRLSTRDGLLYTITRTAPDGGSDTTPADTYSFTAIDPASGAVRGQHLIGAGEQDDTLQMVGTITPDGVSYQGTLSGLFRITRLGAVPTTR